MGTTLTAPASGIFIGMTVSGTNLGVVSGTRIIDGWVDKAVTDQISTAFILHDNFLGQWTGSFNVGNEIRINIGSTSPASTRIFTGLITDKTFVKEKNSSHDYLELQAQDYGKLLKDITATEDFSNLEIGSIVKSLIAFYAPQITTTNVQNTGITINRFVCKKKTVFELLRELSQRAVYNFYVDTSKDLHFEPIQLTVDTETGGGDSIVILSTI